MMEVWLAVSRGDESCLENFILFSCSLPIVCVTGVEICGALKNVLAIAAGIVEGLDLGHNALAALISQGCAEIRWLSQKVGAKPATISGLSGLGDIMLTCYGDLSRNRRVGVRLGRGERLEDILASSSQV
jgi:glycerol-3-phosphate dehydrogenase (NAD+)